MGFQQDYQYYFQTMSKDSFVIEYLLLPIILFLIIILIYSYIKKKLLRDEKIRFGKSQPFDGIT